MSDTTAMTLLQRGVPLSLLIDITDPDGPASTQILESEGEPADQWWLPRPA